MKPVSPVIPGMDIDEVVYAADQPQYQPLPAFKCVNGKILTREVPEGVIASQVNQPTLKNQETGEQKFTC